jgi:tRNA (cmo5U34)-methyltransferase
LVGLFFLGHCQKGYTSAAYFVTRKVVFWKKLLGGARVKSRFIPLSSLCYSEWVMKKDKIYTESLARIADFRFDEQVADVFSDMIERSVPGYRSIINMLELLTRHYAQDGTTLYDLGCSLGTSTLSMWRGLDDKKDCRIVAVDNSSAMVTRFRDRLQQENLSGKITVLEEDLLKTQIQEASVVVMNFTLQFIPLDHRKELLTRIAQGLRSGGVLVLSEKIEFESPALQKSMVDFHHEFKRAHGYSDLEVSQKRSALEKVLLPESIPTHRERLLEAGFSSCEVYFQCFNFVSMLAIKE